MALMARMTRMARWLADCPAPPRSVRQWKKDVKPRYSTFLVDKEKLAKFLNTRQVEIDEEMERKRFGAKQEQ